MHSTLRVKISIRREDWHLSKHEASARVEPMLDRRRRRRSSIGPTLGQCIMFTDMCTEMCSTTKLIKDYRIQRLKVTHNKLFVQNEKQRLVVTSDIQSLTMIVLIWIYRCCLLDNMQWLEVFGQLLLKISLFQLKHSRSDCAQYF